MVNRRWERRREDRQLLGMGGEVLQGVDARKLSSLWAVRTHRAWLWFGRILVGLLIGVILGLIFIPWRQTVVGGGRVWVYAPQDRPQLIEAPITARIKTWLVTEGQKVDAGQALATLDDVDKSFLSTEQLALLLAEEAALKAKLAAAQTQERANSALIGQLQTSLGAAVPRAGLAQQQALNRALAAEQRVRAALQKEKTAQLNQQRVAQLLAEGLRSTRDSEVALQELVAAQAETQQAQRALSEAQQAEDSAMLGVGQTQADASARVQDALDKQAKALQTQAETRVSLAKIANEISAMQNRTQLRTIKAPVTGVVVRLTPVGAGQVVKEGQELAMIAPTTHDQTVELTVSHFDAPLVTPGAPVRLQFAGWPALQFSGWPSVAVGTFAGRVLLVDAVDDGGAGKGFRVIVKPDMEAIINGGDEHWPSSKFLRPGTDATGWILLNEVPLGYELWRQFNAFPPSFGTGQLKDALKGDDYNYTKLPEFKLKSDDTKVKRTKLK